MPLFLEYKPTGQTIQQWLSWHANRLAEWRKHNQLALIYPTRVIVSEQDGRFRFTEPSGASFVFDISVQDGRIAAEFHPRSFRIIEATNCDCTVISALQPNLMRRRKRK